MRRRGRWSGLVVAGLVAVTLSPLTTTGAQAAADPGTPYTFGDNTFGQLGDGNTTARLAAGAVPGLDNVADLDGGRAHVIALTTSGTVMTWGHNQYGQLGLGTVGGQGNSPATVPGLTNVIAVAAGHYHSMALTSDGAVWAWGYNASGQVGDGTKTSRGTPQRLPGTAVYTSIAAGADMSYALRSDGTVWAWGLNTNGELGNGTTTASLTPVQVQGLANVVQIAAGRDHGLALLADGSVWTWGWNMYGQLGDGTTTDRTTPVEVLASGGAQVDAGAHHSYLLKTDGTVWAWGRNYRDELGDGTTTQRLRPVQVLNVSNAVSIGSGRDDGMAVLADGTLRDWGYNASGQLGDGTTTSRSSAIVVPGISNARVAAGGDAYTVVLVDNGTGPPPNQDPIAVLGSSCTLLVCDFNSTGSHDPDGTIASYAWDFGDGGTSTDPAPQHTYAADGTYSVTLTVTDNEGATGQAATSVTVSDQVAAGVAFRAGTSVNKSAASGSVVVPASVQAGDQLVLFASPGANVNVTTPAGWTLLGSRLDSPLRSLAYTETAGPTTAGSTVTASFSAKVRFDLTLVAYSGAGAVTVSASAAEPKTVAAHRSPALSIGTPGSWVLSYWVDKTTGNPGWTLPTGVTGRVISPTSGLGLVTSVTGDSGPLAAGSWPGATATSGTTSAHAVAWSVAVPPA
jgi:alpha-tubulin suppressor-like RCC1 family protein